MSECRAGPPLRPVNVTECNWHAANVRLLRNWIVAGSAPAPPPDGTKATQPPGLGGPTWRAGPGSATRYSMIACSAPVRTIRAFFTRHYQSDKPP